MIVYYRDSSVEVTSAGITVDGRGYRFEDLSRIWHQRRARSWRAVAGRSAWALILLAPVIAGGIALLVALRLDVSGGTRAIMVGVAILIGLSAALLFDPVLDRMDASFDRGVRLQEIWAEQDGNEVRLLQTADAARFGRIYRAVQRAVDS